ncbi:DNA (cytosine-5)-methyltransferase 1 [Salinibacter ruber]|uniref:DNA cytosine methyltransferase n=1 Tax=Salinibacter ruber TaxID=146919 RepID=UPI002168BABE|nr:DNA cytosine methyltransferase [Salinibacter ruber]MCS3633698.1 DNA (cytosine-5)-methyltransferase 1 [Salinibacter ruber]MCS3712526.1 DNA (cytosine-5)-methyltransferase 1 [Salinibacter ruber]
MAAGKVVDLFSGAGGFTLGAVRAGFEVVLCVDNDEKLTSQHDVNFPDLCLERKDLSTLPPENLRNLAGVGEGELAGVIGGPPCQGFSEIGNRNPDDERNTLVGRFFLYVSELEPAFFVMENVPGILHEHGRPHLESGLRRLPESYDYLEPRKIDASEYGLPTSRERVFVIGYDTERIDSLSWGDLKPETERNTTVHDALHDLPSPNESVEESGYHWAEYRCEPDEGPAGRYARQARSLPENGFGDKIAIDRLNEGMLSGFNGTDHTDKVVERFSKVEQGGRDKISKCPRLKWDNQCGTLRAGTGSDKGSYQSVRPIHPKEDRVITIREAARLQGFPDWFQFDNTKWHSFRMIGNSVPPSLAESILRMIYHS